MGLTAVPGRVEGADPDAGDRGPLIALALARAVVAVVFCGFGGVALLWVLELGNSAGKVVLAVALLAALLGLQFFYFGRPGTDLHAPWAYAALAVQACLVYLPLAVFGQAWISQPSFLAGSVLLVLPPRAAWPLFAGIVAGTGLAQYGVPEVHSAWNDVAYIVVNSATAGLFVYGLTRLARLVAALHQARDELAKTAVAHERLRFARNLHDLLGSSLSAIAPKAELTVWLLRRNPERARQELSEILQIARRAVADLRSVARLYRETSLDGDTETLASRLAASNVELRVDLDRRELPPPTRAALAAVVREGVAYMLLHRETARCEIVLRHQGDRVSVDIVTDESDGATPAGERDGYADLSATVSTMAGELTTGMDADRRLRLHVTLPVTTRPPERLAEAADEPKESIPSVAAKFAGWLVVAVFCGLFLQAVMRLTWVTHEFLDIALGTASLLAALVLQLAYFSRPGARLRTPTGYLLLGLQAILVYLPWLLIEPKWTGLAGFVGGSALLVLRPALGWSVFATAVASTAWAKIEYGTAALYDYGHILVTLNLGLIIYGLTWMARSVRRLQVTRRKLAAAAVAQTRLRFAQDLHDLLGLSLSAICLKSELADRLIVRDPARAATVVSEMLEICRHALAEVRSVAGGYHHMSLNEECRTAKALLDTAGLNVRMDIDHGDLPPEVSTTLAAVLREGVTNVLRHSKGEHCELTIRGDENGICLSIVNDGATQPPDGDYGGSGIRNMSDRVTALGGSLTAGSDGNDRFLLRANIPAID